MNNLLPIYLSLCVLTSCELGPSPVDTAPAQSPIASAESSPPQPQMVPPDAPPQPPKWTGSFKGIHPREVLVNDIGKTTIINGNFLEMPQIQYEYEINEDGVTVQEQRLDNMEVNSYHTENIYQSSKGTEALELKLSLVIDEPTAGGLYARPTHTLRQIDTDRYEVTTMDRPWAPRFIIHRTGTNTVTRPAFDVLTSTPAVDFPAAAATATATNFLYTGLWNDVLLKPSHPDMTTLQIEKASGAEFRKSGEGYEVKPLGTGDIELTVSTTTTYGSRWVLPTTHFSTRPIPDPSPRFAGKGPSDKTIAKTLLENAPSVGAIMENFDFDVVVKVKRFNVTVIKGGTFVEQSSSSNMITPKMKELFRSIGRGSVVYLEDFIVTMSDGTERALPAIKLKVI